MQPLLAAAVGLLTVPAPNDLAALAALAADFLPPPLDLDDLEHLLAQLDMSDKDATRSIRALAEPEAACPGCLREAGIPWQAGATSRSCPRHVAQYARQRARVRHTRQHGATKGDRVCSRTGACHCNQADAAIQFTA